MCLSMEVTFFVCYSPCFQFRKIESGEALTPKAMKATIRALGIEFQGILEKFNVHNITSCGVSRTKHSPAQHALLALAGVLPFAAFIATLVLCCMHSNGKFLFHCFIYISNYTNRFHVFSRQYNKS